MEESSQIALPSCRLFQLFASIAPAPCGDSVLRPPHPPCPPHNPSLLSPPRRSNPCRPRPADRDGGSLADSAPCCPSRSTTSAGGAPAPSHASRPPGFPRPPPEELRLQPSAEIDPPEPSLPAAGPEGALAGRGDPPPQNPVLIGSRGAPSRRYFRRKGTREIRVLRLSGRRRFSIARARSDPLPQVRSWRKRSLRDSGPNLFGTPSP